MHRMCLRTPAALLAGLLLAAMPPAARADSSSGDLASYYDRHMARVGDVAYGWGAATSRGA